MSDIKLLIYYIYLAGTPVLIFLIGFTAGFLDGFKEGTNKNGR